MSKLYTRCLQCSFAFGSDEPQLVIDASTSHEELHEGHQTNYVNLAKLGTISGPKITQHEGADLDPREAFPESDLETGDHERDLGSHGKRR